MVAYDLTTGRIAFARPVPGVSPLRSVQALSIDPSERVLAAVVPAGDGTWRVLRWDLPSGRQHATVTLPGPIESVPGFWLASGGRHAMVVELPPQDRSRRRDGGAVAHLDLDASSLRRRVLVNGLLGPWTVAVSPDGHRLATALTSGYTSPTEFGVWDVASGALRARVDQPEPGRLIGGIALDGPGDRLFVGWILFPLPAGTGDSDVRDLSKTLARAYTRHVSVWQVGGRGPITPAPTQELALDLAWSVARPLGTAEDSPVALLRRGAVGIVFPSGSASPLARLTGGIRSLRDPQTDPGEAARRLCSILTDQTESDSTRKLRPAGADGGPVCP